MPVFMSRRGKNRAPGTRTEPERIVLDAEPGSAPSPKPPVRIYVGSEPGQHRAERVFVWSIACVRDRSRRYEIYLMKDLVGFDRTRWLTGFTNYRFTIPHFAGGAGKAIYNDVDQMYLADPAQLFDLEMGDHGFLAISERDTSVMLIDCARMAKEWTLDLVRSEKRKAIERRVRHLWGPLDRGWNSRDLEYSPGHSKVLHFTTIHTQPWQPFPEMFVYQGNAVGEVWHELERSADAHGFHVFDFAHPSASFRAVTNERRAGSGVERLADEAARELRKLLAEENPASVLELRLAETEPEPRLALDAGTVLTRYRPPVDGVPPAGRGFDGVIALEVLQHLGEENVGWVLHELFGRAGRFVFASVSEGAPTKGMRPRDAFWWYARFEAASRVHPGVRWRLVLRSAEPGGRVATQVRDGGRREEMPRVWVLADEKAGHTTQSVGLAERLGWPYEVKKLNFTQAARISNRLRGASLFGLDRGRSDSLAPPWPDLVIATGRNSAPVARWIGEQSHGRARIVQLGRKGADNADVVDLAVSCAHFRLPSHPRRIETVAPLSVVSDQRLDEAARRWGPVFTAGAKPRVGLIVGGTSATHALDAATARRMAGEVRAWTEAAGGSLFAITSPRTGVEATEALAAALGPSAHLHRWQKGEPENPYLGFLAVPEVLVVTGESESMLAEAVATRKPVYIYPLPERAPGLRLRVSQAITERAYSRPRKEKGTVRPQQKSEYICARLIQHGVIRPPRDLRQLHQGLIECGAALPFGAPLTTQPRPPLREIDQVVERVKALFGAPGAPEPGDRSEDPRLARTG
jgi:mitochondrial fission protein ELM1